MQRQLYTLSRKLSRFILFINLIIVVISLVAVVEAQDSVSIRYTNDPQTPEYQRFGAPMTLINFRPPVASTYHLCRNDGECEAAGNFSPRYYDEVEVSEFNSLFETGRDGQIFTLAPGSATCTLQIINGHRYCGVEGDADRDGVVNSADLCPETGGNVDAEGCPIEVTIQVVKDSVANGNDKAFYILITDVGGPVDLSELTIRVGSNIIRLNQKFHTLSWPIAGATCLYFRYGRISTNSTCMSQGNHEPVDATQREVFWYDFNLQRDLAIDVLFGNQVIINCPGGLNQCGPVTVIPDQQTAPSVWWVGEVQSGSTWLQAKSYCEDQGLDLASFSDLQRALREGYLTDNGMHLEWISDSVPAAQINPDNYAMLAQIQDGEISQQLTLREPRRILTTQIKFRCVR